MDIVEYPDIEMMMMDLANKLAGELRSALDHNDFASIAVPGGTTPGPMFDSLCAADLDWSRVNVMLTDERWVPETSERSNTRLLRERLLTDRASAARYVPLYTGTDTPEESLDALEATLKPVLPLTVLLLGMGTDMHTASIFPGADRLDDALHGHARVVPMRAPGAPEPRVTLSGMVLRDAINAHILITGAEKREAIERARHLSAEEAPVSIMLRHATIHWAES
ncbi:6-phosphogluconolactonase [Flavimaricola marinus]|uniref:6-phosphogluconolactonase n=1 Tax=Flavimaricola marinus TaxID=1819565 RepID=A0A238LGA8_9RHOB|nr:6-phosphogluconolactonase [Flavimaricola marinus]SMY07996.1 6-phosphogluconolactonase [Flavimaricola marinus]